MVSYAIIMLTAIFSSPCGCRYKNGKTTFEPCVSLFLLWLKVNCCECVCIDVKHFEGKGKTQFRDQLSEIMTQMSKGRTKLGVRMSRLRVREDSLVR
jgi:hypothetical protein